MSEEARYQKLFEHRQKKQPSFCCMEKNTVEKWAISNLEIFYPHFNQRNIQNVQQFSSLIKNQKNELMKLLSFFLAADPALKITKDFFNDLEKIWQLLDKDATAIYEGDPAAGGLDEVLFCYPGLLAMGIHRQAHFFYQANVRTFARILSEYAHQMTGIDIHPGAQIGEYFCIDHGTGVVIGETTVIGNRVKIYQGVTLGALSVEKQLANKKRHPTIEDECVIYAHATILGGNTVIGHHSVIGGNVWATKSVPPHSTVYHKSEIRLDVGNSGDVFKELNYEI
ncbi:MAG: serine O-acetyltransferase EpsC [Pseudomonadota bacterium]